MYRLITVTKINDEIIPDEDFILGEEEGFLVIFNPDCKKCVECINCSPDIKYYAIPDDVNGTLTEDKIEDLKRKGLEALKYKQQLKNPPVEAELL